MLGDSEDFNREAFDALFGPFERQDGPRYLDERGEAAVRELRRALPPGWVLANAIHVEDAIRVTLRREAVGSR